MSQPRGPMPWRPCARRVGNGAVGAPGHRDGPRAGRGRGIGPANAELEGAGVVHAAVLERLLCSAKLQVMVEDTDRSPLWLGRLSREPTKAMIRALRYRDRGVPVPRLRGPAVHRGPSPGVVVQGRSHRPGQPVARLWSPPPPPSRASVATHSSCRRNGRLVLSRRDQVPSRAGTAGPGAQAIHAT